MAADVLETRTSRALSGTWRVIFCVVFGVSMFALIYGPVVETLPENGEGPESLWFLVRILADIPLGIAAIVLYSFRRHAPLVLGLAAIALGGISTLAAGAALLSLVSIATRRRPREILLAGGLSSLIGLADVWTSYMSSATPVIPRTRAEITEALWFSLLVLGLTAAFVLIGVLIGADRSRRRAVFDGALLGKRAAEAEVARAASDERTRIAREMHDALAHRLSLVAMHAGALEYRDDLSPEQVRTAAGVIAENSRTALEELRDILGVLRSSDLTDARVAQPAATDLPTLIAEAQVTASIDAQLPNEAALGEIPPSLGLHLYRVVQEALTNHRKHAPGTPLRLSVTADPGVAVSLHASNPRPSAAAEVVTSGHGLVGVAERVRLAGGTFQAGISGTDFTWELTLPWPT